MTTDQNKIQTVMERHGLRSVRLARLLGVNARSVRYWVCRIRPMPPDVGTQIDMMLQPDWKFPIEGEDQRINTGKWVGYRERKRT